MRKHRAPLSLNDAICVSHASEGYTVTVSTLPPVPHPVNLNLESTLGCNLECVMCGSHLSGVTKLRRSMDADLLAQIEAEVAPGVTEVSLTVAGEPFLTPRLPQFVAMVERSGAQLSLNSNGTLLKDTRLLRRVMRRSAVIRFSVDGASKGTYESIRVGADFDEVVRNIRMVVGVRKQLRRSDRPRLVMCAVLMHRNVHELDDLVRMAHGLGLDRLDVAHVTVLVPELESESLHNRADLADSALRSAQRVANQLGFRVNLPPLMSGRRLEPSGMAHIRLAMRELGDISHQRLDRLRRSVSRKVAMARWARKAGGAVPCHFLQNGVFVTIGGDVAPCPMPGRPLAGNLHQTSFRDLWNGPVLTAMRQGFIDGTPFECCAHCSQNPQGYEPSDEATAVPPDYDLPGLEHRVTAQSR